MALLDFDGTLREGWTLSAVLEDLALGHEPAARALRHFGVAAHRYRSGRISHDDLVLLAESELSGALLGLSRRLVRDSLRKVGVMSAEELYPFVDPLMKGLRSFDVELYVVTGAPSVAVQSALGRFGPLNTIGLDLRSDDEGRWEVTSNPGGSEHKRRIVDRLASRNDILLAIGDSASDLPMLEVAEIGVVVGEHMDADPTTIATRLMPGSGSVEAHALLDRVEGLLRVPT